MRHFILSTAVAVGLMALALDDASAQGRSILEIGPSTDRSIIVEQFQSGTVAPAAQSPGTPQEASVLVYFDFDSDALRPEEMATLDKVASAMTDPAFRNARFLVEGHTDESGTWEYNLKLSQRRANSVRQYLVQRGVGPNRVDAIGYSFRVPLPDHDPRDVKNRRVEIIPRTE